MEEAEPEHPQRTPPSLSIRPEPVIAGFMTSHRGLHSLGLPAQPFEGALQMFPRKQTKQTRDTQGWLRNGNGYLKDCGRESLPCEFHTRLVSSQWQVKGWPPKFSKGTNANALGLFTAWRGSIRVMLKYPLWKVPTQQGWLPIAT